MTNQNNHKNNNSVEDNLSKDYVSNNLKQKYLLQEEIKEGLQKEVDKTKKEIQELNKEILKVSFIEALGIISMFQKIEEYEILKKIEKDLIHLCLIIPEKRKNITNIKLEVIKIAQK